ncbi:NFX1-type zinc finger-containing protein 1 [Sclerotinia borealis F-4128]|uniref:NFX1-type zinc finger-containing protein 1 n=1 Tax=Sclerotinia borealis (strain F-4128) TaxID=1432307 RepID=W9CK66_SCLBF|nr:NFX1-type zinc finger-containing protein 1 [Sclerotinia borealis F-4128]
MKAPQRLSNIKSTADQDHSFIQVSVLNLSIFENRMASFTDDPRVTRLNRFFHDVIHGRRTLSSARDGKTFIEAICSQQDPATTVYKILSSPAGLSGIQTSMRLDTTPSFLNGCAVLLLRYLQEPSLRTINSGLSLSELLTAIVEPPFFWDGFIRAFQGMELNLQASHSFAWLLLELLNRPGKSPTTYVLVAKSPGILDAILKSSNGDTRNLGHKIKHTLSLDVSDLDRNHEVGPGGRHNNDHANHREVLIMPTADELLSKERPFLRTPDTYLGDVDSARLGIHIDNQFRLLREDMLEEIRNEVQKLQGLKAGKHRGLTFDKIRVDDIYIESSLFREPWGLRFKCQDELPSLKRVHPKKRVEYLNENRHILRQGTTGCLFVDGEPIAFPAINRNEEELAQNPAKIILQFQDETAVLNALVKLKTAQEIKLIQLDTSVFAFEPFLKRLQEMNDVPLAEKLLSWNEGQVIEGPSFQPLQLKDKIRRSPGKNLHSLIQTSKSVILDEAQINSLLAILYQKVSLIQGPPGTGKSFIGALGAKILHDFTSEAILVVCYTNHALDQFLEELLDIGIPPSDMIRLGAKSTPKTKKLSLRDQPSSTLDASQWDRINKLENSLQQHQTRLESAFKRYHSTNVSKQQILDYLEFLQGDLPFFDTFLVSTTPMDGMTQVGKKGKAIGKFYLLDRWIKGEITAGTQQYAQSKGSAEVWAIKSELRSTIVSGWTSDIIEEMAEELHKIGKQFNADQAEKENLLGQRDVNKIKSKRIIGCTTTAAAKYSAAIQAASPGVLLVEEAGEILEAHIFTALGKNTQQLILVGDHQQLRPKCNSYSLKVEQGDGYNLDMSLFERLVLDGFPHVTLTKQYRSRPEISSIIRHLTYPDLIDADSTRNRSNIRGVRDNVVFIDHRSPEHDVTVREMRNNVDPTSSKKNEFEANMILKCVKYLAQQGYGSDKLVVLTPYVAQLKLLYEKLIAENDPILNDLDKSDLLRSGLYMGMDAKPSKPSLRISTVDNYQGEESDIVLISMTRSNSNNDIGFLSQPQRLNVLVSRARNGLIMVGNSETFINSRKGKDLWKKFFDLLSAAGHVYQGFPVKCENHPDRMVTLSSPDDFENQCPDGGCQEKCGVLLKCKIHHCPSSCHQVLDHSKIPCRVILEQKCSKGHTNKSQCHEGSPSSSCSKCEKEKKEAAKQAQKDLDEQLRQDDIRQKHQKELEKVQNKIDKAYQEIQDIQLKSEQVAVLAQKKKDLSVIEGRLNQSKVTQSLYPTPLLPHPSPSVMTNASPSPTVTSSKFPQSNIPAQNHQNHLRICLDHNSSKSKSDWQRQKDQENAKNSAIDDIMEMIGLEDVKSQVLRIKSKVDTSKRQGTDLKKERLGLVLLGNPGTGKTTVARLYAKILTTLQVLPGDEFVETTGSHLANGGVKAVQNHLEVLDAAQGGVYFIDEAYQLTEGHNVGGKTILDYLLTEIENLVGKVIFVFAGYRRQMEKFFEHNPGLQSRLPYTLHFEDYTDAELLKMLQYQIHKFYPSPMKIEDGQDGLYMQIAVQRLGRGRGREGFGNARALENMFARVRERQAERLTKERRDGLAPDDNLITKEDLIGPDPSQAILKCEAWDQLQSLTGLKSVKDSVRGLVDMIKTNYERELKKYPPVHTSLNRVFLGSPGTGKTTVAKLYGLILSHLGLLSNGEVVTKNPADFIGSAMGQSEENTKNILASTAGKVLIIDEAYMLYSGSDTGIGGADMYRTAVIDTIVAEVQNVPGDDQCVVLLGYEDKMIEMFQNVNPGLTRRFSLEDAFYFADFNDQELEDILNLKMKKQGLKAAPHAISIAIDLLGRARNGLNFGNGGEVENLLSRAKHNYQSRQSKLPVNERSVNFEFEPQDFDPDFDRAANAEINLKELFEGVIGCNSIVAKLDGYLKVARNMKRARKSPRSHIPMNFIFKGPPGTGKTTTALKIGQLYYDMGLLSEAKVIECSASDLIGSYVGQTGPKTIKKLELGLGKVLFIDEAYRLNQGQYGQDAIDELVDAMTKPKFANKMILILAGYENDMNSLLGANEGLNSRFADEIIFQALSPKNSLLILQNALEKENVLIDGLKDISTHQPFLDMIAQLSGLPAWGNARDMITLANSMIRAVYQSTTDPTRDGSKLVLSYDEAMTCIQRMIDSKKARANVQGQSRFNSSIPDPFMSMSQELPSQPAISIKTATSIKTKTKHKEEKYASMSVPEFNTTDDEVARDPGVSDAAWNQLQQDKKAADKQAQRYAEEMRKKQQELLALQEAERKAREEALREIKAKHEAERQEQLRLREEARLRELKAREERERLEKERERRRLEEEERKRMDAKAQVKLREMGVCMAGFQWIKQEGGYRCEGGSHWVMDSELGM